MKTSEMKVEIDLLKEDIRLLELDRKKWLWDSKAKYFESVRQRCFRAAAAVACQLVAKRKELSDLKFQYEVETEGRNSALVTRISEQLAEDIERDIFKGLSEYVLAQDDFDIDVDLYEFDYGLNSNSCACGKWKNIGQAQCYWCNISFVFKENVYGKFTI